MIGHPVTRIESARLSILPSPSVTLHGVEVGGPDGEPMATIERFDMTIELVPLLQGEVRVTTMRLVAPRVTVRVGTDGRINWLSRRSDLLAGSPDKIILNHAEVRDGTVVYINEATGAEHVIEGLSSSFSASTLLGPWRFEDLSFTNGDVRFTVRADSGRVTGEGALPLQVNLQRTDWPADISFSGDLATDPDFGWALEGDYTMREIAGTAQESSGWRSNGKFILDDGALELGPAVVEFGPVERVVSLAGEATVQFEDSPSFSAFATTNQIDLDRALGADLGEVGDVRAALEQIAVAAATMELPLPRGDLVLDVPVIVAGGSIIEGFRTQVSVTPDVFDVVQLGARFPGDADIELVGEAAAQPDAPQRRRPLRTRVDRREREIGFRGDLSVSVLQPATFAGWLRGQRAGPDDAARLLSAFSVSAGATLTAGRVDLNDLVARIGASEITGDFDWGIRPDGRRVVGSDLSADRVDLVQLTALAELIAGGDLDNANLLADDYLIRFSADAFATHDVTVRDVVVDAEYTGDVLNVKQVSVGDFGGASIKVTAGQIRGLTSATPQGEIAGVVRAQDIGPLAVMAERTMPGSAFAGWLADAAPYLVPASLDVRVTAPPEPGLSGVRLSLEGRSNVVGSTIVERLQVDTSLEGDWRDNPARLDLVLAPQDPGAFLKQVGLASVGVPLFVSQPLETGSVIVRGRGVLSEGVDATIAIDLAGARLAGGGKAALPDSGGLQLSGSVDLTADNVDTALSLMGLSIPGAPLGTPVAFDKVAVEVSPERATLSWRDAVVAELLVDGDLAFTRDEDGDWRHNGRLAMDEVDLPWVMALGLGFAPLPTGEGDETWSRTPFGSIGYGDLRGVFDVRTERLNIADWLTVVDARFDLDLQAQRFDLRLNDGVVEGGDATGRITVQNVGGNARVAGQFDLANASLAPFIWSNGDWTVATGTLGLTGSFEATGRSPAGLVSSLTGGGVISVDDGEVRGLNPNAARVMIRESDLGQEFDEASLVETFGHFLDADGLEFGSASGPYDIAAGSVRLNNLRLTQAGDTGNGQPLAARGDAVFDLNDFTLDSTWALEFAAGDNKVEETDPVLGLSFEGPIKAPSRTLEVVPFLSYLNLRLASRELEILELEQADRLEKERLRRLMRKLREDEARRTRLREEAEWRESARAVAARAALANLEVVHARREAAEAELRIASSQAAAERARDTAGRSEGEAARLAETAAAARAAADRTRSAHEVAVADASALMDEARRLETELVTLSSTDSRLQEGLVDAVAIAAEVDRLVAVADEAVASARGALDSAEAARALAADAAQKSEDAVVAARADLAAARAGLAEAEAALTSALSTRDEAAAAVARLEDRIADAVSRAADAASGIAAAAAALDEANGEIARGEGESLSARTALDEASGALETARVDRDAALARLDTARADVAAAENRLLQAQDAVASAMLLGGQITSGANVTDADRRLAADLEARVRDEQAAAEADLAAARENMARLEASTAGVFAAFATAEDSAARAREAVTVAEDALAVGRDAASRAAAERDEAETRLAGIRADLVALRQERDAAQIALGEAGAQVAAAEVDVSEAAEAVAALEPVLADAEVARAEAIAESEAAAATADAAAVRLSELQAELAAVMERQRGARELLASADGKAGESVGALDAARSALADINDRLAEAVARRDELAVSSETLEADAVAAEQAARSAADVAEAAIADMERAVAHAERVASGISVFDVPATYARADLPALPEPGTSVEEIGTIADDVVAGEVDQTVQVTTVPGQTVPPLPRLRPEPPVVIQ